ncbi:MAG: LysE family transporter [Alphaproteobacteria bacterium]|nr:LysE family transporter [Alphaproteobacteria bacterium]
MTDSAALIPFLTYCLVMTLSPGPNNLMVLATAARVGLTGATPLAAGIAIGSALQFAAVAAGFGGLVASIPGLQAVMKLMAGGLLLWIAYRIAFNGPIKSGETGRAPAGFCGGAAFQWVNPKAWAVTTGAAMAYLPPGPTPTDTSLAALILAIVSMITLAIWACGGSALRTLLSHRRFATGFNMAAALLLIASLAPLLFRLD